MAAPWNGSTALGWLWDSTLNASAEPAADVDDAGVLAGPHQHRRPVGRQPAQQLLGVLVGAVLGPHQRQHRQLDVARLAAELVDDQLVLVVGQAELASVGGPLRRARAPATCARIDSKIVRPSVGAGQRVDRVLGMGHQPEHVALLVADPGDVVAASRWGSAPGA